MNEGDSFLVPYHEVLKWGTHVPLLAAAVAATTLPVLELGSGRFSTVLLAAVAATGRRVVTADADATWLDALRPFVLSPRHEFQHVTDWDEAIERFAAETWGVVLVDHWPQDRRGRDLARLAERSELFVLHDSQDAGCGYQFACFPFVAHDDRFFPRTSVASRSRPLISPGDVNAHHP